MKALLFEQFFTLTAICILLSAITFYYANRKIFLITLMISALLLAINHFVVTDREAIRARTYQLIHACKSEDKPTIAKIIDADFDADGLSKKQLLEFADEAFARLKIDKIRIWGFEIHPPVIRFITLAHIVGISGEDYGSVRSDWELTFVKRKDNWYLIKARPLSINLKPINTIRDIFSTARSVW